MIENVITRGMWAFSPDDEQVLHSLTVYINTGSFRRPYVTAEIALSRTMGSGAAKAYIWSFEQQRRGSPPLTVPLEPPVSSSGGPLPKLKAGVSQYSLNDVVSVTFGLLVSNMFANATCTVFVYQSQSLVDVVLRPARFLAGLITGREPQDPGQMQGQQAQTAIVYSNETGRIVHIHQSTRIHGASLPAESQLRSSALVLAGASMAKPEPDLDVLVISEELSPQKRYAVDTREKRLIAS
jgi:hypothetical protein